jgi:hypothetical protein
MTRFSIYLLALLTIAGCGQIEKYPYKISDFRPELKIHIQNIIAEKQLSYHPDTLALSFLKYNCTKEELLKLLRFENPLVRVRAYRTLIYRNEPNFFSTLLNHLDDTTKVTWWYYDDAAGSFMVSDLMIRKAIESKKLSQDEKQILVDSVLSKHSYLETSDMMIQNTGPNEKYYALIKQRAKLKTNRCGEQSGACYALSKFKKKEDTELLKNAFNDSDEICISWTFKAIENFPDISFFPILENYYQNKIVNKLGPDKNIDDDVLYFCRAVAAFKNQESLKILEYIELNNTYINTPYWPPYNKRYVFKAINKFNSPIYSKLKDKVKSTLDKDEIKTILAPGYNEEENW